MSKLYEFDWSDIAFAKKSPLADKATFIAAARMMSQKRIKQLIKSYLPKGDIVWGVAKEDYIDGFDNQPQFKTLRTDEIKPIVEQVNNKSKHKIYLLHYHQRDTEHVVKKFKARPNLFVRGSWRYTFHTQSTFYTLSRKNLAYEFVSPFVDETEARRSAEQVKVLDLASPAKLTSKQDFMRAAFEASKASYDHSFQVGVVLAKKDKTNYTYVAHAHNVVVPYETYAQHHGFAREDNFAPSQDLNFYDTVHAETAVLIGQSKAKNLSLFVNVLPCPTCTRSIVQAGITEVFYNLDHSSGYAVDFLTKAGVKVERITL